VSPPSASPSYALRPCACRSQGLSFQLVEPFVMLRATPQLSAQPRSSSGLLFEHSRDSPGDTRLPAGVCTMDKYSRAVPTSATFELSRVTSRGPPSGPRAATMASQLCISRDSVVSLASLHPCQQAARFLVHTRPPDHQDKPYRRTVLTRVEFEMLTRHSASRPRTPGRIHSEDHILSPRFSPPSSTG
jgi:hypothetical protein